MEGDTTRRTYLKGVGAVLGGGSLAGCAGNAPIGSAGGSSTYTVSIAPVGEVEFGGVPETWVANNGSWADMGIALGLEPPEGVWLTSRYHTQYYDAVDGVSVDRSDMTSLWQDGVSKERFHALDGDVYRAGGLYQGPITYMVLTERTAGQLYGVDEELFDRERVAEVVAGEI